MQGPKSSITKPKSRTKKISPNSVVNDTAIARPVTGSSSLRRKIDFSNVDVNAKLSTVVPVYTNIGAFTNQARKTLEALRRDRRDTMRLYGQTTHEKGSNEVSFTAVPLRVNHSSNGSFILLLDHTGHISVYGKTALIKSMFLADENDVNGEKTLTIKLSGFIAYRWSTKRSNVEDEIFYSFKDGAHSVPEGGLESRDISSCNGSILHLVRDKKTSNSIVPAVSGVIKRTQAGGAGTTVILEDATGYCAIVLSNCDVGYLPALGDTVILKGIFKFSIGQVAGAEMVVAAPTEFKSIDIIVASEETIQARKAKFETTKDADFQFSSPFLAD